MVKLWFIDIQAVSDLSHRANVEWGIWISPIQLLAQVADMKTYCIVLISCGEIAPDLFVNLCIGQHMAFIGGQQQENPIFFCGRKPPFFSVATALHTLGLDTFKCRATSADLTMPFFFLRTRMASR